MLGKKKKEPNKFAGKRRYSIRSGTPEKVLKRLNDLYELLQCDPDDQGYVITTFKEMNELTEMDVNIMTIMIHNGMIRKANTGSSPKFKYKWDTIKPTMDMAVKLIDKKLETKKGPDNVVSESQPESLLPKPAETEIEVHNEPDAQKSKVLIDYHRDGDLMTVRVNLEMFKVDEASVINAIMALMIK